MPVLLHNSWNINLDHTTILHRFIKKVEIPLLPHKRVFMGNLFVYFIDLINFTKDR